MRYVGFLLLTAHPSSKWMDPAFSPQKEKVVVVYSEEVLQGSASVLLRLSLPPHDAEGAIYVRRRLRLRYLISVEMMVMSACAMSMEWSLPMTGKWQWMTLPSYIAGDS